MLSVLIIVGDTPWSSGRITRLWSRVRIRVELASNLKSLSVYQAVNEYMYRFWSRARYDSKRSKNFGPGCENNKLALDLR